MKKKLGYFDVFSLVIGSIIGWGSFTLPGKQFLSKSGVINTTLGLFIGGALVIIIQFAYHIMLKNNIEEGGEFSYALNNSNGNPFFDFFCIAYLNGCIKSSFLSLVNLPLISCS